jgi:hypothetical protein
MSAEARSDPIDAPPAPPAAPAPTAPLAQPPKGHGGFAYAALVLAMAAAVWAIVLTGAWRELGSGTQLPAPPPAPPAAATPTTTVAPTTAATQAQAAIVARPPASQQRADLVRFVRGDSSRIPARWVAGFYDIYARAGTTFGVNWMLIASIHEQETAFSTAPSTYLGLNFAHCCGGPMQFNVTNGQVTTWDLVSDSYQYGKRPAHYDHMTATHPSIYDDFDAIMAAAHLLSADGAEYALSESAWDAAYDYYGHDATGVSYADEVLARAIDWSQHGFCINCGVEARMVQAVHAAYGASVLAALEAEAKAEAEAEEAKAKATAKAQASRSRHSS